MTAGVAQMEGVGSTTMCLTRRADGARDEEQHDLKSDVRRQRSRSRSPRRHDTYGRDRHDRRDARYRPRSRDRRRRQGAFRKSPSFDTAHSRNSPSARPKYAPVRISTSDISLPGFCSNASSNIRLARTNLSDHPYDACRAFSPWCRPPPQHLPKCIASAASPSSTAIIIRAARNPTRRRCRRGLADIRIVSTTL
ncbi:hypothetical protein MRB53_042065 [Persea americana]|nr:hypothetical protein MRB53_042065 [Persea americana]